MAATTGWANAITGYDTVLPDQLLANPRNPKIHPRTQADAIIGSLNALGWIAPVIVNTTTGHVVDGHARIGEAIARGEPAVPVAYVALTPEQEALALATFDPIGAMWGRDREALDALLREIDTTDQALLDVLAREASLAGLTPPDDPLAEWQGMPEYAHEDQTADAAFIIRVFLADADELAELGELLGKDLTGKKFVWFKKQPQGATYDAVDGDGP